MVVTYNLYNSRTEILTAEKRTNAGRRKVVGFATSIQSHEHCCWGNSPALQEKKKKSAIIKKLVTHFSFTFSPWDFPIYLSFWSQSTSLKCILVEAVGRKDDSAGITWENTQCLSVQTSLLLYQYKLIWGPLNTWYPKPEHRWPQPSHSLLMALSFEQIAAWLLLAANTEKKLSALVCIQEVCNLWRRASNENLLCTRSFDEGKCNASSFSLDYTRKKKRKKKKELFHCCLFFS